MAIVRDREKRRCEDGRSEERQSQCPGRRRSCSERYEEAASFAQFEPGQVATPSTACASAGLAGSCTCPGAGASLPQPFAFRSARCPPSCKRPESSAHPANLPPCPDLQENEGADLRHDHARRPPEVRSSPPVQRDERHEPEVEEGHCLGCAVELYERERERGAVVCADCTLKLDRELAAYLSFVAVTRER